MKLKDLINESWVNEEKEETPQVNISDFVENVKNYGGYGASIYREGNLKEIADVLSELAEQASVVTLQETGDEFDQITVSRNMKELKGYSQQFSKFANEAQVLQQRIESLYEDMGSILNRYYEINSNKK
tara:strand:- start:124 stop:510 length:387 start_codon:yes stop_codon:yes gene_type:complete